MFNNFLQKQKYHTDIKWLLLFFALLFNSASADDDKKLNLFSMSIGSYSTDYSGDFSYTIEGDSGFIPFQNKASFGIGVEYSRVVSTYFTLDSSLHFSSRINKIKGTTCRDNSTKTLISCNISLNSRFTAITMFGTYRYPIGSFVKGYLGSGVAINKLDQEVSYKASGYKEKSISSVSSSFKMNLGVKLGFFYKKMYVEYMYFGATNKAGISALGVSSISIGFGFCNLHGT